MFRETARSQWLDQRPVRSRGGCGCEQQRTRAGTAGTWLRQPQDRIAVRGGTRRSGVRRGWASGEGGALRLAGRSQGGEIGVRMIGTAGERGGGDEQEALAARE